MLMTYKEGDIYKLYNYTCDGTSSTSINTGIKLFDGTIYPNGWTIKLDFYFAKQISLGAIVRCRNSSSPYNGISMRYGSSSGVMDCQINGAGTAAASAGSAGYDVGDHIIVVFEYTVPKISAVLRNITKNKTATLTNIDMTGKTVSAPLLIGGEQQSDSGTFSWKSGRFSNCIKLIHW